jgi:prophage antirepressor-like protein
MNQNNPNVLSPSDTKKEKLDIENLFQFENKPVDEFGKIWFKGVDIARVLEYAEPRQAI